MRTYKKELMTKIEPVIKPRGLCKKSRIVKRVLDNKAGTANLIYLIFFSDAFRLLFHFALHLSLTATLWGTPATPTVTKTCVTLEKKRHSYTNSSNVYLMYKLPNKILLE